MNEGAKDLNRIIYRAREGQDDGWLIFVTMGRSNIGELASAHLLFTAVYRSEDRDPLAGYPLMSIEDYRHRPPAYFLPI